MIFFSVSSLSNSVKLGRTTLSKTSTASTPDANPGHPDPTTKYLMVLLFFGFIVSIALSFRCPANAKDHPRAY